jgi:hypothetical protein
MLNKIKTNLMVNNGLLYKKLQQILNLLKNLLILFIKKLIWYTH